MRGDEGFELSGTSQLAATTTSGAQKIAGKPVGGDLPAIHGRLSRKEAQDLGKPQVSEYQTGSVKKSEIFVSP